MTTFNYDGTINILHLTWWDDTAVDEFGTLVPISFQTKYNAVLFTLEAY